MLETIYPILQDPVNSNLWLHLQTFKSNNSFALTFDGKKLAVGLMEDFGYADLIGHEEVQLKQKTGKISNCHIWMSSRRSHDLSHCGL